MAKGGSKFFKLKINTETGQIVKKVDENNNQAIQVTQQEIDDIYQNQGFKHVATILHSHSSPGCVYVSMGSLIFKLCGLL
jgi:hypothetical protein